MTTPSALTPAPVVAPEAATGLPGSPAQAARAVDTMKNLALDYGVCVRPVTLRRTDLVTGVTELIDLPCGATCEDKCPPCAKRTKCLRQAQIREGWHRTDEPNPGPDPATEEQKALLSLRAHLEYERAEAERYARSDQVAELDDAIIEMEAAIAAEGVRGRVARHMLPRMATIYVEATRKIQKDAVDRLGFLFDE